MTAPVAELAAKAPCALPAAMLKVMAWSAFGSVWAMLAPPASVIAVPLALCSAMVPAGQVSTGGWGRSATLTVTAAVVVPAVVVAETCTV